VFGKGENVEKRKRDPTTSCTRFKTWLKKTSRALDTTPERVRNDTGKKARGRKRSLDEVFSWGEWGGNSKFQERTRMAKEERVKTSNATYQ